MSHLWTPDDIALARREWQIDLEAEAPTQEPSAVTICRLQRQCDGLRFALLGAAAAIVVLFWLLIWEVVR
jgi:hypothetical protein